MNKEWVDKFNERELIGVYLKSEKLSEDRVRKIIKEIATYERYVEPTLMILRQLN